MRLYGRRLRFRLRFHARLRFRFRVPLGAYFGTGGTTTVLMGRVLIPAGYA